MGVTWAKSLFLPVKLRITSLMKTYNRLLSICALIAMAYFVFVGPFGTHHEAANKDGLPEDTTHGNPLIGGDFSLTNQDGEAVNNTDLEGRYALVFFGFTNCPHICPTTTLRISNAMDALPEEVARDIRVVFITIDPERDTPEAMKAFLANYRDGMIGLTGTNAQIDQVKAAYKAYAAAHDPDATGNYDIDHSSFIYLMGKDGVYIKHFPHTIAEEKLSDALITLTESSS